jgi:hypothetical protein
VQMSDSNLLLDELVKVCGEGAVTPVLVIDGLFQSGDHV